MALIRQWMPSPNYSSRGGSTVRLIVLHTAEGSTTIESLGAFFASPSAGVSSHVGIDDKANTVGEFVARPQKAWTAANANPVAVQAELCAFASWSSEEWHRHPMMLSNVAQWVAEEAAAFGIPLVKLSPSQAQGSGRGVCQHRDLGSWGGNHSDCGNGFPIDEVLAMAGGAAIPSQVLHFASGQESKSVSLSTGPDGTRVDMLFVATDSSVHHWWAGSPEGLFSGKDRGGEMLGGNVRAGGGVSGGWTADKSLYVACCDGTDDRPYVNWTGGDGKWSGWHPVGDSGTLRTPA